MLVGLFGVFVRAESATPPSGHPEWEFVQEIGVNQSGLMKVEIPWEAFQNKGENGADFRLVSSEGKEVAYLISAPMNLQPEWIAPTESQSTVTGDSTVHRFSIGAKSLVNLIEFETTRGGFTKAITLEGSLNGTDWKKFQQSAVFFSERSNDTRQQIPIPAAPWTLIRLTIHEQKLEDPTTPRVMIKNVRFRTQPESKQLRVSKKLEILDQIHGASESRIFCRLESPGVRLNDLMVESEDLVYRRNLSVVRREVVNEELVERELCSGAIQKFEANSELGAQASRLSVGRMIGEREMILKIENGGNPSLRIGGVEVRYEPRYLVFQAAGKGSYWLYSGNGKVLDPRYDLASFSREIAALGLTVVEWGTVGPNPDYQVSTPVDTFEPKGAPLDDSAWTYHASVQVSTPGLQRLDLGLHVLAHSQSSLADLRLMYEGAQWPYLLQRNSFTKSFDLTVESAPDPKRPSVGRWRIDLPEAKLPIRSIQCVGAGELFDRNMVIYEEKRDGNGRLVKRVLGNSLWSARPGSKERAYSIHFSAPEGAQLYLECDNGDNAAVEFSQFRASYSVASLYFKSLQPRQFRLSYGMAQAAAPRYDLNVIASKILSGKPKLAVLEEPNGGIVTASKGGMTKDQLYRYAFWGVLTLVVFGLLFVVGKLLPAPGSENTKP